ncbi:MAG: ATP synthase subunit I [Clostridiales bacterium]|nr:ATP synthase subunit I [Clostridiales bacterium]
MKSETDEKLSEIVAGILLSGGIIQVLFFVAEFFYSQFRSSRASFAAGLWIGVAAAVALALHMYRSIDRALEMEQEEAERYMHRVYLIRAAVIVVMAALLWYTKAGSVMASFLGIFCLISGTWLQPLVHKIMSRS